MKLNFYSCGAIAVFVGTIILVGLLRLGIGMSSGSTTTYIDEESLKLFIPGMLVVIALIVGYFVSESKNKG